MTLVTDQSLERPLLVLSALTKSASSDFQRTALLLSEHTDLLHEMVHNLQLVDNFDGNEGGKTSLSNQRLKRRRRF